MASLTKMLKAISFALTLTVALSGCASFKGWIKGMFGITPYEVQVCPTLPVYERPVLHVLEPLATKNGPDGKFVEVTISYRTWEDIADNHGRLLEHIGRYEQAITTYNAAYPPRQSPRKR